MDMNEKYIRKTTGEELTINEILRPLNESQDNIKRGLECRKRKDELSICINDNLGNFFFSQYRSLLHELHNDTALTFRFIYLCTKADYNGVLRYGLFKNNKHHEYMTDSDLIDVFGLSKNTTKSLKDKLYKYKLIIKIDNKLVINDKYCSRGKQNKKKLLESTRIFDNGITELYKTSKPTDHKRIGLLFLILPYVNRYHNVVCVNPEEFDVNSIIPMTIHDITNVCGLSPDKANRLHKDLLQIKILGEYTIAAFETGAGKSYHINPKVYFAGTDTDTLTDLINMFSINNKL